MLEQPDQTKTGSLGKALFDMHFSRALIKKKNKTNQSTKDILPSISRGDYGAKTEPFPALKRTQSGGRNEPSTEVITWQAESDWCNLSYADGALGDFRGKRAELLLKLGGGETEEDSCFWKVASEPGLEDEVDGFVQKECWDDSRKQRLQDRKWGEGEGSFGDWGLV